MNSCVNDPLNFVVAVIMDGQDRLLLLKRSPLAMRAPGTWGFAGGRMEAGESPDTAMSRELAEEIGSDVALTLLDTMGPLPSIGENPGSVHLYKYHYQGGAIRLNPEHTQFQWVDQTAYATFDLMPGVDLDLTYFGIWPERPRKPG